MLRGMSEVRDCLHLIRPMSFCERSELTIAGSPVADHQLRFFVGMAANDPHMPTAEQLVNLARGLWSLRRMALKKLPGTGSIPRTLWTPTIQSMYSHIVCLPWTFSNWLVPKFQKGPLKTQELQRKWEHVLEHELQPGSPFRQSSDKSQLVWMVWG